MYFVSEHHQTIIEREIFDRVQNLLRRNAEKYPHPTETKTYPFTSEIRCAYCGKNYRRKTTRGGIVFICSTYNNKGKQTCASKAISEPTLYTVTSKVLGISEFNEDIFNGKVDYIEAFNGNELTFHFKDGSVVATDWQDILLLRKASKEILLSRVLYQGQIWLTLKIHFLILYQ